MLDFINALGKPPDSGPIVCRKTILLVPLLDQLAERAEQEQLNAGGDLVGRC